MCSTFILSKKEFLIFVEFINSTKKYRETHKDLVNAQRRKYYSERKVRDPSFIEYKRQKAKEYYNRKKESKLMSKEDVKPDVKEPEPIITPTVIEVKPDPVIVSPEPEQPQVKEPKKKVKKSKKPKA